jgi:hypothetical protein
LNGDMTDSPSAVRAVTVAQKSFPLDRIQVREPAPNGDRDPESSTAQYASCRSALVEMSTRSFPSLTFTSRRRRVLLSTESAFVDNFLPCLLRKPEIELRLITDEEPSALMTGDKKIPHYTDSVDSHTFDKKTGARSWLRAKAAELAEWADLLIVAPIDAGTIGAMLSGLTHTLTLALLRGWDSSKSVLLTPGMTVSEWNNPLTKRQLQEIDKCLPWCVRISPILWRVGAPEQVKQLPWEGMVVFEDQVRLSLGIPPSHESHGREGRNLSSASVVAECELKTLQSPATPELSTRKKPGSTNIQADRKEHRPNSLPLEIWLSIFEDHLQDWEIAKAVGIPTRLKVPTEWQSHILKMSTPASLEYTILRGSFAAIKSRIEASPRWKPLSDLTCHLTIKFSRIDILSYLSEKHPDLFWTTAKLTNLPYRASAKYGNPKILTWWRDSPAIPSKDCGPDAVDGASRAGFVQVLEWWRTSGLPLKYSDRALESASAEGRIAVLDWWKNVSANAPPSNLIPLKVGKSVLLAAQSGRTESLAWWDASGIPYTHTESVARTASTHGHVHVLELWHRLKGSKIIFDNQVLVGPTRNGHDNVLEWWRQSGLRVEFKTFDIEEALEDADPVSGAEKRVRKWWAQNGLNLGVGTSEWMRVKVLA